MFAGRKERIGCVRLRSGDQVGRQRFFGARAEREVFRLAGFLFGDVQTLPPFRRRSADIAQPIA